METGKRIKELRIQKGMTQEELAGGLVSVMNAVFVMIGRPYINPFIKSGETNRK